MELTAKEKMLQGMLYKDSEELNEDMLRCRELCYEFNMCRPSELEKQDQILKKLLGKIGENYRIRAPFYCDYGYNVEIGDNFFANFNLVITDCAKVAIGNNVLIGPNVALHTAGHPLDVETRNKGLEFAYPITIGDNVWIGGGVQILPGVTIGDNAVIGAGSIVTKDIPANVVAVGNPCRVMKQIS